MIYLFLFLLAVVVIFLIAKIAFTPRGGSQTTEIVNPSKVTHIPEDNPENNARKKANNVKKIGGREVSTFDGDVSDIYALMEEKNVDKKAREALADEEIENKDTPFYRAKVVITGVFISFPSRNDLALELQSLGAKVNTSISRRTNIVVVGDDAGPAKLDKIAALQDEGYDIRIMYEDELISIIEGAQS